MIYHTAFANGSYIWNLHKITFDLRSHLDFPTLYLDNTIVFFIIQISSKRLWISYFRQKLLIYHAAYQMNITFRICIQFAFIQHPTLLYFDNSIMFFTSLISAKMPENNKYKECKEFLRRLMWKLLRKNLTKLVWMDY